MNLIKDHLTALLDFQGRENRQPFWLWVLITFAAQYIVSSIAAIPFMQSQFQGMAPLFGRDSAYLDKHPEIFAQLMSQTLRPTISWIVIVNAIVMLIMVMLLAAAVVRRLHDSNRSGWWASPVLAAHVAMILLFATIFPRLFEMFGKIRPDMPQTGVQAAMGPWLQSFGLLWSVGMLAFVLQIVLIVFLALPGTAGPNRFGDDPLQPPFH